LTVNQGVVGSSPTSGATFENPHREMRVFFASIVRRWNSCRAASVEHGSTLQGEAVEHGSTLQGEAAGHGLGAAVPAKAKARADARAFAGDAPSIT
ncbi:hypothetical protein, partial [Stenotrophomonas sp. S41]|uniref:hypothetical protein n=1 Tax=Stenotrophomonas sp. S41 TaxID=2767464 RepID=UPI001F247C30